MRSQAHDQFHVVSMTQMPTAKPPPDNAGQNHELIFPRSLRPVRVGIWLIEPT